jgi:hypothetical protein
LACYSQMLAKTVGLRNLCQLTKGYATGTKLSESDVLEKIIETLTL